MAGPLRMVLLCHDLPDGSRHYDWLLDRHGAGDDDTPNLLSFRSDDRVDARRTGFVAWHLPDHRRLYLRHEGPVGGDRGHVRRVAEGTAWTELHADERLRVVGTFAGTAARAWWGVRIGKVWWIQPALG